MPNHRRVKHVVRQAPHIRPCRVGVFRVLRYASSEFGRSGIGMPTIKQGVPATTVRTTGGTSAASDAEGSKAASKSAPNFWIMKPCGLSRGRGIHVVKDIGQVSYGDNVVIQVRWSWVCVVWRLGRLVTACCALQKYVTNPMLLDGYKFDLRIYVLVTSFSPLEAFLYDEGYARLSTHKYSADPASLSNRFIHLTNSSVQKKSNVNADTISSAGGNNAGGTKTSLTYLWSRLEKRGWDPAKLWADIRQLIVRSLVCVDDVIPYQPNSFEMFGYDVLIDDTGRPWLVEVNSSPSLGTDSDMDHRIKTQLIMDTCEVVGVRTTPHHTMAAATVRVLLLTRAVVVALQVNPAPFDRVKLVEILKRRQEEQKANERRPYAQPPPVDASEEQIQVCGCVQHVWCALVADACVVWHGAAVGEGPGRHFVWEGPAGLR